MGTVHIDLGNDVYISQVDNPKIGVIGFESRCLYADPIMTESYSQIRCEKPFKCVHSSRVPPPSKGSISTVRFLLLCFCSFAPEVLGDTEIVCVVADT